MILFGSANRDERAFDRPRPVRCDGGAAPSTWRSAVVSTAASACSWRDSRCPALLRALAKRVQPLRDPRVRAAAQQLTARDEDAAGRRPLKRITKCAGTSGGDVRVGQGNVSQLRGVVRAASPAARRGRVRTSRSRGSGSGTGCAPHPEQRGVVVARERITLGVGELQPGRGLAGGAAEQHVGPLGLSHHDDGADRGRLR